jgi:hypothetical protein
MRGTCLAKAFAAAAATLILIAIPPVFAQESLDLGPVHIDVQNAAETDWAISTAGKNNVFNNNSTLGIHCPSEGHNAFGCGLSTNGNSFNIVAFRYDGLLNGRISSDTAEMFGLDNWDFFVHARTWTNIAPYVDGDMPTIPEDKYMQRYPGDAWTATVAQNEWELDAAEAYTDLRKGRLWVRLGKQQMVYGEELGFQVLDAIDSLDFRRHSLFNYSGLEFSDARIGTWAARATYDLGDYLEPFGIHRSRVTGYISEFQPDVLMPAGQAYNTTAAAFAITPLNGITRARHHLAYGAIVEWSMLNLDWSFNFYSHPERTGVFSIAPFPYTFAPGPGGVYPAPRFFGCTPGTPCNLMLTARYPQEFIYGGMVSYMIQPIYTFPGADIFNGDIVRFSGTYTPNKTLQTATLGVKRMGDLNLAADVEKDYRWTEKLPSMYILAEYNYRSASPIFLDSWLRNNGDHMFNLFLLSLSQPLPLARWTLVNVVESEANHNFSWFDQPAVVYKPTSSQEYDAFWNFATGTLASQFGPDQFSDEFVLRAIYKF